MKMLELVRIVRGAPQVGALGTCVSVRSRAKAMHGRGLSGIADARSLS